MNTQFRFFGPVLLGAFSFLFYFHFSHTHSNCIQRHFRLNGHRYVLKPFIVLFEVTVQHHDVTVELISSVQLIYNRANTS